MTKKAKIIFTVIVLLVLIAIVTISVLRLSVIWPAQKQTGNSTSGIQQTSAASNLRSSALKDIDSGKVDQGITKLEKAKEMFLKEKNNKEVLVTQQQIDFAAQEKVQPAQVPTEPYRDDESIKIRTN